LTLLDPVFGQFVDDCREMTLTREDYAMAHTLKSDMCKFYADEDARRGAMWRALQSYGIPINGGHIGGSKHKMDGHVCTCNHPILILEIKNDIGWKGVELCLQVVIYYHIFCDECHLWNVESCHPCIVIFLAGQSCIVCFFINTHVQTGPHLGFAGCALTGHPTMEVFSLLPLNFHSTNDEAYDALAHHCSALKKVLSKLEAYAKKTDEFRPSHNTPSMPTDAPTH
jgi:hypothetical protein